MSHKNLSTFFHVYNTTQQTINILDYYAFNQSLEVRKSPTVTNKFLSRNAYTYAEIQANTTAETRYSIQLDSQLSLNHEGYQIKNVGDTGAMDDGAYGWGTGSQGLQYFDRAVASPSTSDANQTRIWGVRTV